MHSASVLTQVRASFQCPQGLLLLCINQFSLAFMLVFGRLCPDRQHFALVQAQKAHDYMHIYLSGQYGS